MLCQFGPAWISVVLRKGSEDNIKSDEKTVSELKISDGIIGPSKSRGPFPYSNFAWRGLSYPLFSILVSFD
jgi:hypothetical protein